MTFTRTGERRYAVGIEFPDAPALIMHPAPGFDPKIPHDMVHLAVELEYGIAHGVFGQVADGGHARTFRRADGAVDRTLRRRGDRLVRQYGDQLARSESLAQAATVARHRGARPACARLDALSESWQRLGVGETMSVSWPPRRSR